MHVVKTWINLRNIMLSKMSSLPKDKHYICVHIYAHGYGVCETVKAEARVLVAPGRLVRNEVLHKGLHFSRSRRAGSQDLLYKSALTVNSTGLDTENFS